MRPGVCCPRSSFVGHVQRTDETLSLVLSPHAPCRIRMISLATHKFVSDIAHDARQVCDGAP